MDAERLKKFEALLDEAQQEYALKSKLLEEMRAQGKEKSATFKQYMADKLLYSRILSLFEKHGLL